MLYFKIQNTKLSNKWEIHFQKLKIFELITLQLINAFRVIRFLSSLNYIVLIMDKLFKIYRRGINALPYSGNKYVIIHYRSLEIIQ